MTTTPDGQGHSRWRTDRLGTVAAVIGLGSLLPFGLWAMIHPRSFFDGIVTYEPYNQHFIQDLGAFRIGLGGVLLLVLLFSAMDALTVALLGIGLGTAAHALSHVIGHDLGGNPQRDIPMFTIIALLLLVAGALRVRAMPRR